MKSAITITAVASTLLALAAGLYLGGHPGKLPEPVRDAFVDEHIAVEAETIDAVKDNYFRKISRERLENGSLRGIVEALGDRFSHFFTPPQFSLFEQSTGGVFSGVGLQVVEHPRGLRVTGLFARSPAKRAGIRKGDLITTVNGRSIAGESSDLASARIKGKAGTFVKLTVVRPSRRTRRTLRLRRAKIKLPIAQGRLRNVGGRRFGVLRLVSFTSGVHSVLRNKARKLLNRGAEGLVLDLRANGGGLLEEGVLVSSVFVPSGTIVSTRGRARPRRVFEATGNAIRKTPLVVLVDHGTASSSEIVTAALHDRLGAKVVGRRTFGKGVFQQLFTLPNGGGVALIVGSYFTPDGHNLNDRGIKPDIRAADDPDTRRDEALDRTLRVLAGETRRSAARG